MPSTPPVVALFCVCGARVALCQQPSPLANPAIDPVAFMRVAEEALQYRESHRLSEDAFAALGAERDTVVLDTRSREKYDELHVRGAISLPFTDIAVATLQRVLPDRSARILIYCNNNFTNAESAFPSKLPSASLNLSTYIALYDYGYRNVWELGPVIDARTTRLRLEGSAVEAAE